MKQEVVSKDCVMLLLFLRIQATQSVSCIGHFVRKNSTAHAQYHAINKQGSPENTYLESTPPSLCLFTIQLLWGYAEAFDSVVHAKLLAKLACYGINEQLLVWIKTFQLVVNSLLLLSMHVRISAETGVTGGTCLPIICLGTRQVMSPPIFCHRTNNL